MKAIILAAGRNKNIDFKKPKCLLPFGGLTILENQINLLNLCGIKKEDIILVIGERGEEWSEQNKQEIGNIHSNIVINKENVDTKNSYSLFLAVKNFDEDIITIDGDIVLKEKIMRKLLEIKEKNVVVSRIAYSISEKGGKLEMEGDKVKRMGEFLQPNSYPWYIYSGIARINKETLKDLKLLLKENPKKDVIDNLNNLLDSHDFYNLDYSLKEMSGGERGGDNKLIGGSYAELQKLMIVRKEVRGRGREKLVNEIKWLETIPQNLQHKFTKVRNYGIDNDCIWFEMDYHDLPCLRELILKGEIQATRAVELLEKILDFMFKEIYTRKVTKNKGGWVWKKHIVRVNYRLLQTKQEAPIFSRIMSAKKIVLNGKEYENIPFLIKEICERPLLLQKIEPKNLRMIHGDLHFQNILVSLDDPDGFILADPRGELSGSDLYYDMGKLWHSFNGLYDFLHTNMFSLKLQINNEVVSAMVDYNSPKIVKEYEKIKKELPKKLERYNLIKQDPNWELKILFAEAMHFSSVMPFHLKNDGKEEKAIAMYLTGVRLLNEFFERFKVNKIVKENKLINVNSNKDYLDLLENKDLKL